MKTISEYLNWPMTEDIDRVLSNLSPEKKLELAAALTKSATAQSHITTRL